MVRGLSLPACAMPSNVTAQMPVIDANIARPGFGWRKPNRGLKQSRWESQFGSRLRAHLSDDNKFHDFEEFPANNMEAKVFSRSFQTCLQTRI